MSTTHVYTREQIKVTLASMGGREGLKMIIDSMSAMTAVIGLNSADALADPEAIQFIDRLLSDIYDSSEPITLTYSLGNRHLVVRIT